MLSTRRLTLKQKTQKKLKVKEKKKIIHANSDQKKAMIYISMLNIRLDFRLKKIAT